MSEYVINEFLLLEQLRNGNYRSFCTIYKLYIDELYDYAKKMNIELEDAEDALQEIFSSLWIKREKLQILDLKPWLFASLKKQMLNQLRKKKYKNTLHKNLLSIANIHSHGDKEIYSNITVKEVYFKINSELDKLSPQKRLIFRLSRFENKSHKEIASELNISELTVKKQINNVLKVFKTKLSFKSFFTFLYYPILLYATSL